MISNMRPYICPCCGATITHVCTYRDTVQYTGGNYFGDTTNDWPPLRRKVKVVHFGFGQIPESLRLKDPNLPLAPISLRLSPRRTRTRARRHRPLRSRPGAKRKRQHV